MMIENFELNKQFFFWINDFAGQNKVLDWIFIFMAEYLIYIIIILFLVYFGRQIWRDKKIELKELIVYSSASLVAWIITEIIKFFIDVERPFLFFNIETLMKNNNILASFPSGHTTLAFAFATSIYVYNKKIGRWILILAGLVALGRVLVGVHYPLDILVGAVIGIAVPIIISKFWKL